MGQMPAPAFVEIVERRHPGYNEADPRTGYVKPDEVRINGVPLAVPRDEQIEVHGVRLNDANGDDVLKVTLTIFARRIVLGPDNPDPANQRDSHAG